MPAQPGNDMMGLSQKLYFATKSRTCLPAGRSTKKIKREDQKFVSLPAAGLVS
ncbi:hypothetical protein [Agriterribacter sp.]|uniref:hypothetical protein n=1 Tax=Agriterribacter sp. TaxID=2821509 RepID=UPI002C0C40D2|nr:hypothetical protein [Agriterribacter sp.]HRO44325.1 hypothetical protein [Agriterribacter sp.]HRQ16641.1 hypothetical protein [Agriterribacter sp.]